MPMMRGALTIYAVLALLLSVLATATHYPSTGVMEQDALHQVPLVLAEPEHEYNFQEFQPRDDPKGSFRQPYFRFAILFRRKEGITEEFLHQHWKTVHADLTLTHVDFAHRVQRYVQFHQDEEHQNKVKRLVTAVGGVMQLAPYDGIAEFHTTDYEAFEKFILSVFADPIMLRDQKKFADTSSPLHVMAGYDNLIFGSGDETSSGYNGIMPDDRRLKYSKDED